MKFTTPIFAATDRTAAATLALASPLAASSRSNTVRGNTTLGRVTPRMVRRAHRRPAGPTGRRTARAVFAVVVVAGALGWGAAPASAHNSAVGSSPTADAVVTEQPGVFSVTTSDLLLDLGGTGSGSAIVITGPASAPLFYGDGCATVSGATVETAAQLGAAGLYTVIWQTVSTDGHSISDEFTFDWQPAPDQSLADGAATAPSCGTEADAATSPPAAAGTTGSGANDSTLQTIAWMGGAFGAVLLVVGATLVILRRKTRP
ncbi:MAG: copper resistance protein CopC [Cryobacterium sp.]|uniref:copper resistance CopC family protein n=1 Tax=unclassified Cryobacterium TaxID=2649013 RepID=UPI0018C9C05C|nr:MULTISPECIES: copper resistance CopC family protein [unclassified Cryobacterium]MCY7404832.1 copper resistance protein CopC [Cryobacterium sp.]MEC5154819.1 methionine-rich copper-binding protein CopC [Cryobacterium sp. CAN_C3]